MEATKVYSNENLRFRRAYIRERLTVLKSEREELLKERDAIDQSLEAAKAQPKTASIAGSNGVHPVTNLRALG